MNKEWLPTAPRITARAVELFRQMQAVPDGGAAWWDLHSDLCAELKLEPWMWPAIEPPDAVCMYPPNKAGGMWFPEAQQLYCELAALAR